MRSQPGLSSKIQVLVRGVTNKGVYCRLQPLYVQAYPCEVRGDLPDLVQRNLSRSKVKCRIKSLERARDWWLDPLDFLGRCPIIATACEEQGDRQRADRRSVTPQSLV